MKIKKSTIVFTVGILTAFMLTGKVSAAVQSRPGVPSLMITPVDDFIVKIRQMEVEGGTLGKKAQLDSTTYLDSSNNGVDVHMAKNTEWGAAAMLAASSYGSAPSGTSDASTTGNATGIYQMADGTAEYVAGIYNTSNYLMSKSKKADGRRYVDIYTGEVAKRGDATLETKNWKGSSSANFVTSVLPVFIRNVDALFGYDYGDGGSESYISSRAVLCVGSGL